MSNKIREMPLIKNDSPKSLWSQEHWTIIPEGYKLIFFTWINMQTDKTEDAQHLIKQTWRFAQRFIEIEKSDKIIHK